MNSDVMILLIAVVATVVVAVLIVKFGHYLRDRSVHVMEQIPETTVWAAVLHKDLVESDSTDHTLAGAVVFRCTGGLELTFRVDMGTYNRLQQGQQGELVYRNQMFLGFSDPNNPEQYDEGDDATEVLDFSYTGFDESIDKEIPIGMTQQDIEILEGKGQTTQDEKMLAGLFEKRIEMPKQVFVLRAETDSLDRYPALQLLSRSQIPGFLKSETKIQAQFKRVYIEALSNLKEEKGAVKRGLSSEWLEIRGNVFFLQILMQEFGHPHKHQIAGRLFINLKREEE